MSTQVEFLLLSSNSQCISTTLTSLTKLYTGYERVLVIADKRQQLEQLDELLWQNSSEQFIPYSLDNECYGTTASVLLTDKQPERQRYKALININGEMTSNPEQFRSIIELVLVDEVNKEKARERYKLYRQRGFIVSHRDIK